MWVFEWPVIISRWVKFSITKFWYTIKDNTQHKLHVSRVMRGCILTKRWACNISRVPWNFAGQIITEPFLRHLLTINIFIRKYNNGTVTNVTSRGVWQQTEVFKVLFKDLPVWIFSVIRLMAFCRDFNILVSLLHWCYWPNLSSYLSFTLIKEWAWPCVVGMFYCLFGMLGNAYWQLKVMYPKVALSL